MKSGRKGIRDDEIGEKQTQIPHDTRSKSRYPES